MESSLDRAFNIVRPSLLDCKNEYLVFALREETAALAVVGYVVREFCRLKKPRSREMSACSFALHSVCLQIFFRSCSGAMIVIMNFLNNYAIMNHDCLFLAEHGSFRRHGSRCGNGQSGNDAERIVTGTVRNVVYGQTKRLHHRWLLCGGDVGEGESRRNVRRTLATVRFFEKNLKIRNVRRRLAKVRFFEKEVENSKCAQNVG